jgi:hypothetical protein
MITSFKESESKPTFLFVHFLFRYQGSEPKPAFLPPIWILLEVLCRNYRGGLSLLAFSATKSMLKNRARTYLPPNSQSMQKSVEGVYPLALPSPPIYSLNKGAIDKKIA